MYIKRCNVVAGSLQTGPSSLTGFDLSQIRRAMSDDIQDRIPHRAAVQKWTAGLSWRCAVGAM